MAHSGDTRLCLGAIAGAHGVRGDVRLKTFTEDPLGIAAYGPLSSEDGKRRFEIRKLREAKDHVVATVTGIKSREEAIALKGTRLYVDRDKLPDVDEDDTWYHADLIGLEARLENGSVLGKIQAVQDYGAGDLLEIALAAGGTPTLLPFTMETVPQVDIKAGFVVIVPPEGLIDEEG